MNNKTFYAFIGPSLVMMLLFIAAPLASVFIQSFYVTQGVFELTEVETCTPGFLTQTCTTETVQRPVYDELGNRVRETRFVGLNTYRTLLEPEVVKEAWSDGRWLQPFRTIDFYRALRFTLMFTLVTLPLVIFMGLALALAVNNSLKFVRGPIIFISLLPFIITPVIGALSIRWLFIGDGLLTRGLEYLTGTNISMFSQGWTIELLMMFYRVWHVAPFAFVIFYAGLQTVNQDTMDASIVDGASRWERLRYVVLPHLQPLIVFVTLIHLMDAYRVFEEIIGFSSEAHVISLQWLTFDFLMPDDSGNRAISRASASSMLTMIGIIILLIPVLRRTWRDHKAQG